MLKVIMVFVSAIILYTVLLVLKPAGADAVTWLLAMILFFVIFIAVVEYNRYLREP